MIHDKQRRLMRTRKRKRVASVALFAIAVFLLMLIRRTWLSQNLRLSHTHAVQGLVGTDAPDSMPHAAALDAETDFMAGISTPASMCSQRAKGVLDFSFCACGDATTNASLPVEMLYNQTWIQTQKRKLSHHLPLSKDIEESIHTDHVAESDMVQERLKVLTAAVQCRYYRTLQSESQINQQPWQYEYTWDPPGDLCK
jgi:hypothetical protein